MKTARANQTLPYHGTTLQEQSLDKLDSADQSSETELENISKINANHGIQVISRAADILRALKTDNDGLSLGQIAHKVNLPRSTVQRIVNALIAERLVMASASEGGLRLGPEIQSLAMASKLDVAESLRPLIGELSRVTGETVDLAVLRANQLEFIDQVEGTYRLRTVSSVGDVFPLTDTANGKAILALMKDTVAASLINAELNQRENTKMTLDTLIDELATVKKQGYSLDCDEHTVGISAVGAAFSDNSNTLYAISIPVPSQRFKEKQAQLIDSLLVAVKKAQELMGVSSAGGR